MYNSKAVFENKLQFLWPHFDCELMKHRHLIDGGMLVVMVAVATKVMLRHHCRRVGKVVREHGGGWREVWDVLVRLGRPVVVIGRSTVVGNGAEGLHSWILLGLHASILEPNLDLPFGQRQRMSDFNASLPGQVAIIVKLLFQLKRLVSCVGLSCALVLSIVYCKTEENEIWLVLFGFENARRVRRWWCGHESQQNRWTDQS